MIRTLAIALLAIAMASVSAAQFQADAHPHTGSTTYITMGEGIVLEKTQLEMNIPAQDAMPWAVIEGTVTNPVEEHPVIVQIRQSDGEPARFAQVDIAGDGSFEYRFRVFSMDDGEIVRAFEGDYNVTIYKLVYSGSQSGQA